MATKQIQTCLYGDEAEGQAKAPTRLKTTLRGYTYMLDAGTYSIWIAPLLSEKEMPEKYRYAYFEHNEVGDESAGGLWFNGADELYDYDGVFALPACVIDCLEQDGFDMSYAKDEE